jgi:UDP-N-acetylglucosamine--N-acetylmuramyl-(pentapeptide) pyrophosphoryl-undecaprenol N-acetylglucosamine transferase
VFIAFEDAARFFPARKVEHLGNPVRQKIVVALETAPPAPASTSLRILVVGGSQGARAVSDLVMATAQALAARGLDFTLVHQTGTADLARVEARYRELGLSDRAQAQAFIDDMAGAYANADLVVARAGALTLAELAIAGKPALLIPLPSAADDHQRKNAARFASGGAAQLFDQATAQAEDLATTIVELGSNPSKRAQMSAAMRALARPQAALAVADRLQALASNQS